MAKWGLRALALLVLAAMGYGVVCLYFYAGQESRLFFPEKLPADFAFAAPGPYEEHRITAPGGVDLDAVLIHASASNGVVFFLGGNSGSLKTTVESTAPFFLKAGFDFFSVDYPGFGKSGGRLGSEDQLDRGVQAAYEWLDHRYPEGRLVVVGYSLGTSPAAWVGCHHHPQRVVLLAPFYSLRELAAARYPYLPIGLFKYPMRNNLELPRCEVPVTIFHGAADDIVPERESERLRPLLKKTDSILVVPGAGHADLAASPVYQSAMAKLLADGVQPLAKAPVGVKIR